MVHLERLALAAVLLTFAFGGYFWIGLSVDPAEAASLATPLDAHIPFVPAMLPVYAVVYLMILLPIFLVESPALFRRIVVAYLVMVAICLLCFALFPVSGAALRPDLATVETHPFLLWGLRLNYALDPPVNLFPSLHLAGATLASLAVGKARASYGRIAGILVVPIALSVCAVKQHYWIDAAAGIALGFGVYAVLLARWSPPAGETLARPPRAWLGFAGLLATVYLALYLAYRAGFEPFPG